MLVGQNSRPVPLLAFTAKQGITGRLFMFRVIGGKKVFVGENLERLHLEYQKYYKKRRMMISTFSPLGGKPMKEVDLNRLPENVLLDQEALKFVVMQDYYCARVAYAFQDIKKGQPVLMKDSEAQKLMLLLIREYNYELWKKLVGVDKETRG